MRGCTSIMSLRVIWRYQYMMRFSAAHTAPCFDKQAGYPPKEQLLRVIPRLQPMSSVYSMGASRAQSKTFAVASAMCRPRHGTDSKGLHGATTWTLE